MKKKKRKIKMYELTINEKQAEIISLALDVFSRLESGQLITIFKMIHWKFYENLLQCEDELRHLQLILTGMSNGNLGIGNVSNHSRIAYDLHQVIRYRLAWGNNPKGGVTVDFGDPLKWGSEPLAQIRHLPKKIYFIYSMEWGEWSTMAMVAAVTLTKDKAEKLLKELELQREVVGTNEDGSEVYDYTYFISEQEVSH